MNMQESTQGADTDAVSSSVEPSIAAVVVTFNRKRLLAECLDALLAQDRPLDRIFVVDQASTDGTGTLLEECGYLQQPGIAYARFETNTGGAGGFSRGVELAHKAGFDWIWLMDDDAVANSDALQKMLPCTKETGVVAVANAKLRLDGLLDRGHLTLAKHSDRPPLRFPILTFSSFVGLLVAGKAVNRIGLPMSELFLQGDDTEYCRRLCTVGLIAFAEDSILVHKEAFRPSPNVRRFGRTYVVYPLDTFYFRYFIWRNRVWIELHAPPVRIARFLRVVAQLIKEYIRTCVVDRDNLPQRLFVLTKAFKDGIVGSFDNGFPFRMRARAAAKQSERAKRENGHQ